MLENPYECYMAGIRIRPNKMAEAFEEGTKAQLKRVVEGLRACPGELISRNNEPFIATFEMLLSDYQSLLEEVK